MNRLRNLRKMYATGGALNADSLYNTDPGPGPRGKKSLSTFEFQNWYNNDLKTSYNLTPENYKAVSLKTDGILGENTQTAYDINNYKHEKNTYNSVANQYKRYQKGLTLKGMETPEELPQPTLAGTRPSIAGSMPTVARTGLKQADAVSKKLSAMPNQYAGLQKVAGMAKSILPYASNILNSFRKVPQPPAPTLNGYTSLNRLNFSDERAQVDRSGRVMNINADRNLDENSAAAMKLYGRGQTMEKLSEVNNREKNANAGIDNQEAQMRMRTDEGNNAKIDDYEKAKVQRKITQQNATSENLSNAVDKNIMIDTEKRREKLALEKTKIESTMFNKGLYNRVRLSLQAKGIKDPTDEQYNDQALEEERKIREDWDKRDASNKKMFGGRLKKVY